MKDISDVLNINRHKERPNTYYYIQEIFSDYIEMSGDRLYGDDKSITGGIASYNNIPVTIIGHNRGRNTKENIAYNFSMSKPEGYRKSLRLMKQAEKFHRPIICFVDTIGAFPGRESEERGQGTAIANILISMLTIETPIISILIGNGGSGGALALSVADEVAMLEYAVLSVISPRACSNILWKNSSREMEAAKLLKMTSWDLMELGVVDRIILEPEQGAHVNALFMIEGIRSFLDETIPKLINIPFNILVKRRCEKYRNIDSLFLIKGQECE